MKFDNVIIGGGLSGLFCGIKLAEEGKKCAIVSSGQSAVHFFSGSFDLLSKIDDKDIEKPLEAMERLGDNHPYQRVGLENIPRLAGNALELLKRADIKVEGECGRNHYIMTPMGSMKTTWLTLEDFTRFEKPDHFPWKDVAIMNFNGFLDFHSLFIQDGLKKLNVKSKIFQISMKEFEALRANPSEMRSSNIAKVFDRGAGTDNFIQKVNDLANGYDLIILPAVFGLFNKNVVEEIKSKIEKHVLLLPALPPSVPGIRTQISLKKRFQELGGTYFLGDHVEGGTFEGNQLKSIHTNNHGDILLEADRFILASGSFYSKGLIATPNTIIEPIFGLDIDGEDDRANWFDNNIFKDQPYMRFGIKADADFKGIKNNQKIENLYIAGSGLAGANPLKEGSGAGISMLTSLHVAEQILKK